MESGHFEEDEPWGMREAARAAGGRGFPAELRAYSERRHGTCLCEGQMADNC